MAMDPVFLEIFKNRIQAISEEMANVVLRTGFTVFVKETADFGTFLLSPIGETFGSPVVTGVNLSLAIPGEGVVAAVPEWHEGDIVITNDPYATSGLSTHLADVWLVKPIFAEGRIIAFGCCFVHSSDVGGKVPGSISPTSYDIFQEGVRIAPVKLYDRGTLNEQILRVFLDNCRIPEQNWGDLRALMASLHTGERRLHELVVRYGVTQVERGIQGLLAYAEHQVRAMIREIPDGEYAFWDYLEGGPGGYPIRLRCRLVVTGDEILMDFEGTDPQVRAAFNLPSCNKQGHYMLVPTLVRYFRTLDPSCPWNSGMVRPVSNRAPAGSVLNPEPPAACGVRAATFIRLMDVVIGALSQAQPDRLPAAGAGQACIVLLAMDDVRTGRHQVGVVQPICGGSGARPMRDGIDGMDFSVGYLRNVPAETLETDMPILIERYGLRQDSGGAGRYRGGSGIELTVRVFAPDTVMTARGMERMRFRPWGRLGGSPGENGTAVKNLHAPDETPTGRIDELLLQPGDAVTFLSQGGGGYGDPYERDVERVRSDVRRGLVSAEAARTEYGVVIADGRVDDAATQTLRSSRPARRTPFVFGPERDAFEAVWSDAMQLALNRCLMTYPLALRNYLKQRAMTEIDARAAARRAPAPGEIAGLVRELFERMAGGGGALSGDRAAVRS
ncbi:MAG TPA: hydantoinase B/oxoprolinase family protein [bacterium]|nr:hydantoinase B/oxoprolinase family protein [bacterium]